MIELARALTAGTLSPPFTRSALLRFLRGSLAAELAAELAQMNAGGMTAVHLAAMIELMAHEREAVHKAKDDVELVWSGPEAPGTASRETSVVVRQLFLEAEVEILISTYAIYDGKAVFRDLAARMAEKPELRVRMFVHIARAMGDTETSDDEIVYRYAAGFLADHWPGGRAPELFYDPRTLSKSFDQRAALHAKCVVVDDRVAFVSSANFTEAAQQRNIEAGVLVTSPQFAKALRTQFEVLVSNRLVRRVPGLEPVKHDAGIL